MTTHHYAKFAGFRVQVEGLDIVQYVNIGALRFGYGAFGERFSPVRCIDVSTHRYHGSNVPEGFQYSWIAHVTGMND